MEKKEKIRVLHLLLSLEIGGMERFVYEHCLGINKDQFEVSVCCIDRLGGFYERLIEHGIHVDLIQKNQQRFDWFFPLKLSKYLRQNTIDILHIHSSAFFHGGVAGFLARTKGVIYTEHGRHYKEPWQLYILDQISSRCVDQIITVSDALEKHLIEKMRLSSKKIKTIINGVNTVTFGQREKPDYLLEEFSIDRKYKIVGTVGRLVSIKDQATLIKAFKLVKDQHEYIKLFIVGEGPLGSELIKLVAELELIDDVIFTGNRSDIPSILNLFDVYVLPSLMEGTSLSLLEAMASCVPCVVTDVGGNTALIIDGVNGSVVSVRDYESIAGKIFDIINDDLLSSEYSLKSRLIVDNVYSLEKNILKYERLYQDLV